jgi:hypothetical protein
MRPLRRLVDDLSLKATHGRADVRNEDSPDYGFLAFAFVVSLIGLAVTVIGW